MPTAWSGVFPALTTKFNQDETLDIPALERHCEAQIAAGVSGLIVLGSLGENGTLSPGEKQQVLEAAVSASRGRVPVLSGVAETTTAGACAFVKASVASGADGFMVLPPMQYVSDPRETIRHLRTIARASEKPIMIYNNPVAYRVDITPEMFRELADEPKFTALKESSEDVRRITEIRNTVGDRYRIFVGVDDLALESFVMGADGWVAGLVCAFPRESVVLYRLVKAGRFEEALTLYRWFTPLLHLDTSLKFIHCIKLAEAMTGMGTETMRAPRLPLHGEERTRAEAVIRSALEHRPTLPNI
jgi:1-pyrroline-4-hydroxy-2-carboxylate deaminase